MKKTSLGRELTPVIPALYRLRQEVYEFEASLDNIVRLCLEQTNKETNKKRKALA
jgi:hypothetical protein